MIIKMGEFQKYIFSELSKVLDNIVTKTSTEQNYLKVARPMEWDKVVELHERLYACMFSFIDSPVFWICC